MDYISPDYTIYENIHKFVLLRLEEMDIKEKPTKLTAKQFTDSYNRTGKIVYNIKPLYLVLFKELESSSYTKYKNQVYKDFLNSIPKLKGYTQIIIIAENTVLDSEKKEFPEDASIWVQYRELSIFYLDIFERNLVRIIEKNVDSKKLTDNYTEISSLPFIYENDPYLTWHGIKPKTIIKLSVVSGTVGESHRYRFVRALR